MHSRKIIVIPEEENENNDDVLETIRRASIRIHNLGLSNLRERRRSSKLQKRNKSANFSDQSSEFRNSFEKLEFLIEEWKIKKKSRKEPSFLSEGRAGRNSSLNQGCSQTNEPSPSTLKRPKIKEDLHARTKSAKECYESDEKSRLKPPPTVLHQKNFELRRKCQTPREKSEPAREFIIPTPKYLKTEESSDERTIEIEPPLNKTPKKGREHHLSTPTSISTPHAARIDTKTSSSTACTEKRFVFDQLPVVNKAAQAKFYTYKRLFPEEMSQTRMELQTTGTKHQKNVFLKVSNKETSANAERKETPAKETEKLSKSEAFLQKERRKRQNVEEVSKQGASSKNSLMHTQQPKKQQQQPQAQPHPSHTGSFHPNNFPGAASGSDGKNTYYAHALKSTKENLSRPVSGKTGVAAKSQHKLQSQIYMKTAKNERENMEHPEPGMDLRKRGMKLAKSKPDELNLGKPGSISTIERLLIDHREPQAYVSQINLRDSIKRTLEKEAFVSASQSSGKTKTKQRTGQPAVLHDANNAHSSGKQKLLSELLKLKDETRKILNEDDISAPAKGKTRSNHFDRLYNEIITKIKGEVKS